MSIECFQHRTARLLSIFRQARHRLPVHLAGERDWTRQTACSLLESMDIDLEVLWLGQSDPAVGRLVRPRQALSLLGTEADVLVVDGWQGFSPDAFGALSGTIRAGGMLILLTPTLEEWHAHSGPDQARMQVEGHQATDIGTRFIQRLATQLRRSQSLLRWYQNEAPEFPDAPAPPSPTLVQATGTDLDEPVIKPSLTVDQTLAVKAVEKVIQGQRRRPLVLVSDRGRGKSSALGIAAQALHGQGLQRILVTAPERASVQSLFDRVSLGQEGADSWLRFLPIAELLESLPETDLLLVDEAAGIPVDQLTRLLRHYPRLVFASTVHGYEGCGRGFDVRFRQVLDRHTRGWRRLEMHQAIRWADHDPLEALTFRLLKLDAEPDTPEPWYDQDPDPLRFERLDRDRLAHNEAMLAQVFGLLVLAHYRTRPSDLHYLLDSPNLAVLALWKGEQLVAAALVSEEGGMDADLCREISQGRRRPRGHLAPEVLASHLGLEQAPALRNGRVVRIVVHPALQGQTLGTRFLRHIESYGQERGWDYLAASFGAETDLLTFWMGAGFRAVRLSSRVNRSSGEHSVLMLKPISEAGRTLYTHASTHFVEDFPLQLAGSLSRLDPLTAWILMGQRGDRLIIPESENQARDQQAVKGFVLGYRAYEEVEASLFRFINSHLSHNIKAIYEDNIALLVTRVMQGRPWLEVARLSGCSGRSGCIKAMQSILAELFAIERL